MDKLPPSFIELVSDCSLDVKKCMLLYLNNLITKDCTKIFPTSVDYDNYAQHINDFIPDDTMDDIILGEVEHMGLVKKTLKQGLDSVVKQ